MVEKVLRRWSHYFWGDARMNVCINYNKLQLVIEGGPEQTG